MNEKFTRVSADEAGNGRTDWKRLRALRDSELDKAISTDPDAMTLSDHFASNSEQRILRRIVYAYRFGRLKPWSRPLRRSELRDLSI